MCDATHLLVGNPTAQSGKNAERIERALELLAEHDITAELLATRPRGETIDIVREALDQKTGVRCVITMGGDGTFREVASGLLTSTRVEDVSLGMLPTGTANDQGRSFGLSAHPDDLIDNIAVIDQGHETRLDAGHIRCFGEGDLEIVDTWFFDSAGWGMSARTLAARNRDREWIQQNPILAEVWRDHLVYAGALLRTFMESYVVPDKFDAVVVADGTRYELEGLTDLLIKNTRVYAGAWVLDQRTVHDDGVFEVIPFRGRSDWLSKGIVDLDGNLVTEEMLNTIGIEHSPNMRGGVLEFHLTPPSSGVGLPAQVDGEEFPEVRRAVIEAIPRAIRLIVP